MLKITKIKQFQARFINACILKICIYAFTCKSYYDQSLNESSLSNNLFEKERNKVLQQSYIEVLTTFLNYLELNATI